MTTGELEPIAQLRLQIKDNGYDLIPVRSDKKGVPGWPHLTNEAARVVRWGHPATGIRTFGNDVFVLDIDVVIEAVRDKILSAYSARWPAFMATCLRRHSGRVTIALIGPYMRLWQALEPL